MGTVEAALGDITRERVDAIVNAAGESLLGGGGVDAAIHAAAGPRLLEACCGIPQVAPGVRCPAGEARLTEGFDLPARYVIHTVGPVYRGGDSGEAAMLASCYRSVLLLAGRKRVRTIAFPSISTGAFGYPMDEACAIAVKTVRACIGSMHCVRFICFTESDLEGYRAAIWA